MRLALALAVNMVAGVAFAQEMPIIPPPGSQAPGPRQVLPPNTPTIETLAGQGFEIKAVERATTSGSGFLVLMQRGGEIRTCLMRLERGSNGQFQRQTGCF